MIKLIKGAEVYAPQYLGKKDILLAGSKVAAIEDNIEIGGEHVQIICAKQHIALPGFIDSLVHITGGGGEGGFTTRTPEVNFTDLSLAGITTLVAALGTDSITRSLENMLAKAKELNQLGLNCFTYSGSYHTPIKTITNDLQKDIALIDECIGVGEIAISDHRASQLSWQQIAKIASDARVGGMLSSKAGIVSIHVGDGTSMLDPLLEVVNNSDIPIEQFYPTHINRNQSLLDAGVEFTKLGGVIDLTTSSNTSSHLSGEIKCSRGLHHYLEQGGDIDNITFSSDGHASLPEYDSEGRLTSLEVGQESSLYQEVCDAVKHEGISLETAVKVITSSPAGILKLKTKGKIAINYDADINLVDKSDLSIDTVIANGKLLVRNQKALVKGVFENEVI